MGCLNPDFGKHWFANIHFSGPCNRKCYFCIGQHMMDLDSFNNLDQEELTNFEQFIEEVNAKGIKEINLTGSNTDPLLYNHLELLCLKLRAKVPGCIIGLRTNGVKLYPFNVVLFDEISVSLPTLSPSTYEKIMGGKMISISTLKMALSAVADFKVNIVLCPETVGEIYETCELLSELGVKKINLREPYGQPHIGNPFSIWSEDKSEFGMPVYHFNGGKTKVMYWDVHYVGVKSINLYASGRISYDYSVTKGHSERGEVLDQSHFTKSGRIREQWLSKEHQ